MATPAQLMVVVANVLGISHSTVVTHDRHLAKAGLRTVGGRGTGAAQMTARDAARLLLAVVGASAVKDSLVPVQRHGRLLAAEGAWRLPFLPVPQLQALGTDHSLEQAIVALIEAGISGNLADAPVVVTLHEPLAWSTITVGNEKSETRTYRLPRKVGAGNLEYDPPIDTEMHGDLSHRHSFGLATIMAVADLLRG
jgi:hypothetical protein